MIFVSCKTNPQQENINHTNNITIEWNINSKIKLESYIDSVKYIPLETHPSGLFNMIEKLVIQNDKIFILDSRHRNQLLVFDTIGNFKFPVGAHGRAPGEFIETRNFTVDKEYIYIIDNYSSNLLLYDLQGNYIETKKLPIPTYDISILKNGDYMLCWQPLEGNAKQQKFKIIITDKNMNIKSELFPINDSDCFNFSKTSFFTQNNENIVFHTLLSDTIVIFNSNNTLEYTKLNIDFKSQSIPLKWRHDYNKVTEHNTFIHITPFITSRFIIGENFSGPYIIDKKNKQVIINDENQGDYYVLPPLFVKDDEIISYLLNDTYQAMVKDGIKRAPKEIEKRLEQDDYVLIKYILK